ncbi:MULTISPECIES: Rieske (2Fe-2S) protein [unclassified Streptomyces]|uniref:Rieske (2Fe-2S) protein n=1 Tax=unclassified Streptomyces TaxID=2593676 RepID=UPI0033F3FC82
MGNTTRRRTVLAAGAAGLAGAALSGCGADGGSEASGAQDAPAPAGSQAGAPAPAGSAAAPAPAGGGKALARTADIPVGGGKVFKDQKVVVTQPTAGQFKAFSATCTHAGCSVASVTDGNIVCPCHQSLFKVSDGSPAGGPATRPLAPAKITVAGDSITLA